MKPSAALSKAAKAAENQAQTLVRVEEKIDAIMAHLGLSKSVSVEVSFDNVLETPVVIETAPEELPVEAEDKPAKKKK